MTGSANTSSAFVVPLTYDMNTNHTALFDRLSKQTLMAGDMRYQNIIKILMNSRETTSQCKRLFFPRAHVFGTRRECCSSRRLFVICVDRRIANAPADTIALELSLLMSRVCLSFFQSAHLSDPTRRNERPLNERPINQNKQNPIFYAYS